MTALTPVLVSEDGEIRSTSLVPQFAVPIEVVKQRIAQLQDFVKGYMVPGEDYGIIPGTQKPTLLKPGAEKLGDIYALTGTYQVTHRLEDWDRPLFHYEVNCTLTSRHSGLVIAQGMGSANSKESRYADRWMTAKQAKDEGVDITGLPSKDRDGKFGSYKVYRVENRDPFTLINTLLKMAKKRAYVDAMLSATRSSGIFTQDMEDIAGVAETEAGGAGVAPEQGTPQNAGRSVGQPGKPASKPADSGATPNDLMALARQKGVFLVKYIGDAYNGKKIPQLTAEERLAVRNALMALPDKAKQEDFDPDPTNGEFDPGPVEVA